MTTKRGYAHKRPGPYPQYGNPNRQGGLEQIGVYKQARVAQVIADPDYVTWRETMEAAITREAGTAESHKKDARTPFLFDEGVRVHIALNGAICRVLVRKSYTWGGRLRYQIEFWGGRWLAITEAQLWRLALKAREFVGHTRQKLMTPLGTVRRQLLRTWQGSSERWCVFDISTGGATALKGWREAEIVALNPSLKPAPATRPVQVRGPDVLALFQAHMTVRIRSLADLKIK